MDGSGRAGPRDGADVGDRVAAAVEELYGADPQSFTERRTELAAAARDAGDRAAAKAIAALRRPTRAAWVVNLLARTDPSGPAKLAELGAALRAAQEAGHGPRLRELSAARGALVDAMTNQALSLAGAADAPPALRLEVSQTLTAALADPGVAADFAAGTLTRAVQWSGFGVLPAAGGGDGEPGEAAEDGGTAVPLPRLGVVTSGARGRATGAGAADAIGAAARPAADGPGASGTTRGKRAAAAQPSAEAAARRQAEEAERLAREAAERAARHREQYEEAERAVASTASAAADALAGEDRLEREVRDLEERLTRARADLAGVRMRARHAEAAERRARQALDRLSRD